MAEAFEFEARPIEGATAAVGEEVTFREEGGKLYALNEDGEPFGVVPAKFASQLEGFEEVAATVASRSGGVPTIAVEVSDGPAMDAANAADSVEAASEVEKGDVQTEGVSGLEPDVAQMGSEPSGVELGKHFTHVESELELDAVQKEDAKGSAGSGSHFAQADASTNATVKKKSKTTYIAIAAVAAVVIVIIACVGLFSGGSTQVATQTVTSDWLSIEVPEDWTVEEGDAYSSDDGVYYRIYSEEPEFYVFVSDPGQINAQVDALYEELEYFEEDEGAEELEDLMIDGAIVHRYQVDSKDFGTYVFPDDYELSGTTVEMAGYEYYFYSGSEYIYILTYCLVDEYDEDADELETILDSVVLEGVSEPEVEMQTISVSGGEYSIEVPAGWAVEETSSDSSDLVSADLSSYQYCGPQKALLQTGYSLSGMEDIDSALLVYETIFELDSSTREQSEYGDGAIVCTYDYSYTDEDNETDMAGYFEIVFSGDSASIVVATCEEDKLSLNSEMLESIVDSLTIENPTEPVFTGAEDGSTETEAAGELEETQTITDGSYSIEVPASWVVEEQELDDDATYDAMFIGLSMDETQEVVFETGLPISGTGSLDTVLYVIEASLDLEADSLEQSTTDDGVIICRYDYAGDGVAGYCKILLSGDTSAVLIVVCAEDELSENAETFEAILDSLTVSNPSAPSF